MERGLEANVLFSRGQYAEALRAYTASLETLAATRTDFKVNLLFNRSACYLKLKLYEKVVEDCETILSLDKKNGKAIGRKIKAMCSLGKFREAQTIAKNWIKEDPKNPQARKELDRLDVIIKALNEQASEDDWLDIGITDGQTHSQDSTTFSQSTNKSNAIPNAWNRAPVSPPQRQTLGQSPSPRVVPTIPYAAVASPKSSLNNNSITNNSTALTSNQPVTTSTSNSLAGTQGVSLGGLSCTVSTSERASPLAVTIGQAASPLNSPGAVGSPASPRVNTTASPLAAAIPPASFPESSPVPFLSPSVTPRVATPDPAPSEDKPGSVSISIAETLVNTNSVTRSADWTDNRAKSPLVESIQPKVEPEEQIKSEPVQENTEKEAAEPSEEAESEQSHDTGKKSWKHRPPPRGLTSQEYTQCPRYLSEGMCRFGAQCSQAHSPEELEEWKERFEQNKQEAQKSREGDGESKGFQYLEAIVKKMMNADNTKSLLTDSIEGVKAHVNCDLKVNMSTKKCTYTWLFTVTSKMKTLEKAGLLDHSARKNFYISEISVGPKRSQKKQDLESQCQVWTNPITDTKTMNERVYRIRVSFNTDIYGTFRQTLILDFGGEPLLSRELCVDSNPVSDLDKLTQDLVLKENERWNRSNRDIVQFDPKPHSYSTEEENLLTTYPPPTATNFTVSEALVEPGLTKDNYRIRMHDLLNIEEMAQYSSVSKYNVVANLQLVDRFLLMPSSTQSEMKFAQGGELYGRLKLNSNLSEDSSHGRLILQNVHTVYIAPDNAKGDKSDKVFEAIVEDKGKNFIFLRVSKECVEQFQLKADMEFSIQVQFQLNRLPLCEMHLAVEKLPDLHVVFPEVDAVSSIPWNPLRQWTDKLDTRLNPKQKEAIVAITSASEVRLPPILLVGPYGTGKTFTLAQAAKAILRQEGTRILICTHSNSAADLYVKDYLHPYVEEDGHTEAKPLRILYRHRWVMTVPFCVLQYCLRNKDLSGAFFRMPTKEDVEAHRVVVATLSTSRYLHNIGLEPGFFTHILLDEAAQAMECEMLLPIGLASETTKIVLAGDHMQLSPEVHSDFARDRNLHVSFLERLYDLYPGEHPCKILLCENYRSHKAIIDYTSELFYDNKLVASGNQPAHNKFYPLSFFSAKGEDVQHQNSTAYYNNAEVYEVVERVSELQKNWPSSWGNMADNGIGVVAPYADQVIRIRSELRKKKMFNVSVERVLNVQGKQFRVVILSTVRTQHTCSSDSAVEEYIDYGFLSNVKLLNTAITRAQSLVAVVGDPVSLCSIGKCRKLWERFIELCHQNSSLHGLTWRHIRAQLDGVELKKTYILNPLAPEFIPNRLRHAAYPPPEPIAEGKFGYTFSPHPVMGPGPPQFWPPGTQPQRYPPSVSMGPFIHPQMIYPPWMSVPGPGYYPMPPVFGGGMMPPHFMPHALPQGPRIPVHSRPPMIHPQPQPPKIGSGPNSPGIPQESTLLGPPLHAGHPFMYPTMRPGPADMAQHLIGHPLARIPVRPRQRQDSGGRPGSAGSHRSGDRHPSGDSLPVQARRDTPGEGEKDPGIQFLPSACNVQRHDPAVRYAGPQPPVSRINPVMYNHNLQQELARYMTRKEGQDQASMFLNQMIHKGNPPPAAGNGHSQPLGPPPIPGPPPPRTKSPYEGPPYQAPYNVPPPSSTSSHVVRGLRYSDLVSREHATFRDPRSYAGVTRTASGGKLGRETPVSSSGLGPHQPQPGHRSPRVSSPQSPYPPASDAGMRIAGAAAALPAPEHKPVAVEQAEHFLHNLEDSLDTNAMRMLQESADSTRMRGILHGSSDSAQLRSLLGNLDESASSEQLKNFYGMEVKEEPLSLVDSGSEVRSILSGLDTEVAPGRRENPGLPLYLRSTGHTPSSSSGAALGAASVSPPVSSSMVGATGREEPARPMSYAGALRSRPPAPSPQPQPNRGDGDSEPDPLDLLKNLNIKASPGTQALYQYFS